jgi:hypothetical protein
MTLTPPRAVPRWRAAALLCALALLAFGAALPGLTGSWVHDDLNALDNPNYSGLDDVLAVWVRHSADYVGSAQDRASSGPLSQTYRPLTMLSLVAVHTLAPLPFAHHLLGFALHLVCAYLLYAVLRRSDPRPSSRPVHGALATLFLLHPSGVESWVWINGRSDVLAGVWLALLLWALHDPAPRGWRSAAERFVIVLLGSCSKETFIPAALIVSGGLPLCGPAATLRERLSRSLRAALPSLAAVALYLAVRGALLPWRAHGAIGQTQNPLASAAGWLFLPKLLAIAAHALVSLRAANQQSLGWDQLRPLGAAEWLCGALGVLAIVALLRARDLRGLVLCAAAAACLAPCVMVMNALWFGLDRYLYMPLLLLSCAAAPYAVRLRDGAARDTRRLLPLVAAGVLAIAVVDTFVASRAYRDQAHWLESLASERPEDPTVVTFLALKLPPAGVHAFLQHFPPPPWPSSVIVPLIALAQGSGDAALALRAAEYGLAHYPHDALLVAHAFRLRYLLGHKSEALALLPEIPRGSALCSEVRQQLGVWAERRAGAERSQLTAAMTRLDCAR